MSKYKLLGILILTYFNLPVGITIAEEPPHNLTTETNSIIPNNNNYLTPIINKPQKLPLKLDDAVYLALENSRELKIAYLQRILDQQQLVETESQFNPTFKPQLAVNSGRNNNGNDGTSNQSVTLNADLNWKIPTGANINVGWQGQGQWQEGDSLDSENNSLSQGLNFSFSQPLLQGFGKRFNTISIQQARLNEKLNYLNFRNTISQTITDTIISYRSLFLAQERLKIEQLSLENAKKELARLQALYNFGRIPRNDLVERQADIAQREVNVLDAERALQESILELNKILDLPETTDLEAIETPTPPQSLDLPSFEQMLTLVLANNSGYLGALIGLENAKFGMIEAQNEQEWDLRFNFNYGLNTNNTSEDSSNWNTAFTLSRQFGNLSQDNAVSKSEINLQTTTYNLDNTRENLIQDLENRVQSLQDSFRQIELAKQARELEERKLNNAKQSMRLRGDISMTDIINFEQSLVNAQNQELNAIINHLNNLTQLEQFLGTTLDKWQVTADFR